MQNNRELEAYSVWLYKYMCEEVVGSENVVWYRRLFFKLYDDIFSDIHHEFISSGSKAEGLDLPGSDIDLMFHNGLFEVYEDETKEEDVLMLDPDKALPGLTLLK